MFNLPNDRSGLGVQKNTHNEKYCKRSASLEQSFLKPLVETANPVLSRSNFDDTPPPPRILRYHANDPEEPQGGVIDETKFILTWPSHSRAMIPPPRKTPTG